jgi:8-oxo-dGTP pyrophosphatase MutT (NUDIX family)
MTHTGVQRFRPAIYGVLIQDGQVLLVRAPKTFLGVVGFPGGGIELGEAPLDALRREFTEETGLEVEPVRVLWATNQLHRARLNPVQQLIATHWEVRLVGGTLIPQGNGDDVETAFFCPKSCGCRGFHLHSSPPPLGKARWRVSSLTKC